MKLQILQEVMQKIVVLFPITRGIQLMKATFLGMPIDNLWLSVLVMGVVTIICTGITFKSFKWE